MAIGAATSPSSPLPSPPSGGGGGSSSGKVASKAGSHAAPGSATWNTCSLPDSRSRLTTKRWSLSVKHRCLAAGDTGGAVRKMGHRSKGLRTSAATTRVSPSLLLLKRQKSSPRKPQRMGRALNSSLKGVVSGHVCQRSSLPCSAVASNTFGPARLAKLLPRAPPLSPASSESSPASATAGCTARRRTSSTGASRAGGPAAGDPSSGSGAAGAPKGDPGGGPIGGPSGGGPRPKSIIGGPGGGRCPGGPRAQSGGPGGQGGDQPLPPRPLLPRPPSNFSTTSRWTLPSCSPQTDTARATRSTSSGS
mmetsp:Transcript_55701/g.180849  ORF Transcript_55701/g.180849 Transcript_55701/m.180849 type:complete len:306 (+) Transcript_55701:792-1709(+)